MSTTKMLLLESPVWSDRPLSYVYGGGGRIHFDKCIIIKAFHILDQGLTLYLYNTCYYCGTNKSLPNHKCWPPKQVQRSCQRYLSKTTWRMENSLDASQSYYIRNETDTSFVPSCCTFLAFDMLIFLIDTFATEIYRMYILT